MIVRKFLSIRKIIRFTWKKVLLILFVATLVTVSYIEFEHDDISFSTVPLSILGVALAILLGFRNNSAYDRWWEARRIWGSLVNDSRTLARQVLTFFISKSDSGTTESKSFSDFRKEIIYRQIAFVYAVKNHLRKQDIVSEIENFLPPGEAEFYRNRKNVPNLILQKQSMVLQEAVKQGFIEDFRHMQMDTRINSLSDAVGGCERIKNTVFPRQYSYYTTIFTWIFILGLPFGLVKEMGWLTIPACFFLGFIFMVLEGIGYSVENPFENTINDIPMTALCRTIEINLKEQLGESGLPEPVQPVNGFLF
jgi:ion channel-forming bestrophin family protein